MDMTVAAILCAAAPTIVVFAIDILARQMTVIKKQRRGGERDDATDR